MKKVYTKPEIMFEDFTLSVNIAGDCEVKTDTPSVGVCAYSYSDEFGAISLFVDGVSACLDVPYEVQDKDAAYNGFCYHVFTGDNLFNS